MRKITKDELFYMSKVPRLNLVNCVTGYKSANLIGTVSTEGVFWNTLEKLKQAGASSILVLPIEKMMS